MNFTLRDLEAFLGVAQLGNFTRAARALHVSQPALTVRIRHLEDALGVRLLDRTTRSVTLTEIGLQFLPTVQRVLDDINAVADNARGFAGRQRDVVTVAALPSVASTLLPPVIAAFNALHRRVVVRLRDGVAQRVSELVSSGDADFGIGSPSGHERGLRFSPLVSDPIAAVFPPCHPLEACSRITLKELAELPLILMERTRSARQLVDAAFQSLGIAMMPRYEASYVRTALGLVKAGLGVALIAFSAANEAATHSAGLRGRAIDDPMLVREIGIIESATRPLSPAARDFVDAVRQAVPRRVV
jgi:LysR family transcriptional regulator, carnitine catabolism transcriptional activator